MLKIVNITCFIRIQKVVNFKSELFPTVLYLRTKSLIVWYFLFVCFLIFWKESHYVAQARLKLESCLSLMSSWNCKVAPPQPNGWVLFDACYVISILSGFWYFCITKNAIGNTLVLRSWC